MDKNNKNRIAILGSTGSIGTQTLEIVREHPGFQVRALAAGRNVSLLEKQIREFRPVLAGVWEEKDAQDLRTRIADLDVRVVSGMDGMLEIAAQITEGENCLLREAVKRRIQRRDASKDHTVNIVL